MNGLRAGFGEVCITPSGPISLAGYFNERIADSALDKVKGRIIRVSHLGWQDDFDVLTAISAVGVGLAELGCKVPVEFGLAEAHSVLFS